MMKSFFRAAIVLTALAAIVSMFGFGQTKAKSFDDLAGRAVLLEFFAYW